MRIITLLLASAIAITAQAQQTQQNVQSAPVGMRNAIGTEFAKVSAQKAPKMPAFIKKAEGQSSMITETPEGTLYKNLYTYATGFVSQWGLIFEAFSDGSTKDLVISGDSTFYLKNPISQMVTPGWIKGERTQGDTIAFHFPQQIYILDNGDGETYNYYAYRMKYEEVDGENQYVLDPDNQTINFVWRNDSLIKLDDEALLGMGNSDGVWNGLGDLTISATPCPFTAAQPSDDATSQSYVASFHPSSGSTQRRIMTMAVNADSTRAWLKGVDTSIKDAWIEGDLANGKASFKLQFLGLDTVRSAYKFLIPAVEKYNDQEGYSYLEPQEDMELTYNPEKQEWSTDGGYYTNYGYRRAQSYYQIVGQPDLTTWNYVAAAPQKPSIMSFQPATSGQGWVIFSINSYNTQNSFMDPDSTFYNVYFDNNLVTFDPSIYTNFSDTITDIPLNYTDNASYNIETYGDQHRLVIYDDSFSNIGIRAVTINNGERLYSDIAWYPEDPTTGINAVSGETGKVSKVEYYDLSGRRVAQPSRGLYIKTTVYADGTTSSTKTIVNK